MMMKMKSNMNHLGMHNKLKIWIGMIGIWHIVYLPQWQRRGRIFISPCRQNKRRWNFLHATRDKPDSLQRVYSFAAADYMSKANLIL